MFFIPVIYDIQITSIYIQVYYTHVGKTQECFVIDFDCLLSPLENSEQGSLCKQNIANQMEGPTASFQVTNFLLERIVGQSTMVKLF